MKPDALDFKSLPGFLVLLYPLHHVIISPHTLLNRKTMKKYLSEEVQDEIKSNEISSIYIWVFDLFNFTHTHTHTHIYIYLLNYIESLVHIITTGLKLTVYNNFWDSSQWLNWFVYLFGFYRFSCLFVWILWHINHCMLFNAKSCLYIYIKYDL